MNAFIKGFSPYGFSVVVKFGGSLMADLRACKAAVTELEGLADRGYRMLIVPGGGILDKAIETVDEKHPLAPFTAHHACALAQDQTGYLLSDRAFSSKLVASAMLGECRSLAKDGKIPVLLPSRILFAMDPVEWSWDITSDAVAAWITWITSTPRLAILTDVDGVYRNAATHDPESLIEELGAHELAELGHTSIDVCAAHFMAVRGVSGVVINGAHPRRLTDWLEGKRVRATHILSVTTANGLKSKA
ncbi:aspartate kinase [Sinorhizobium americanum]|uniref:amino acid kinase family protein n=1 Tax=Sinorhizobium americanum TaxID=194963 RepID=UPI00056CBF1A|nr:aspartate kinase [Sinorhizobium americanum]